MASGGIDVEGADGTYVMDNFALMAVFLVIKKGVSPW